MSIREAQNEAEDGFLVQNITDDLLSYEQALVAVSLYISVIKLEDLDKYIKGKLSVTEEGARDILLDELKDFADVFNQVSLQSLLLRRGSSDIAINFIDGAKIPFKRPYLISPDELAVLKKHIDDLLANGYARLSTSRTALPLLIIKKPGGSLRVYIDYRAINEITIKNRYPIPQLREILSRISRARWFTVLDIIAAFNILRIRRGDKQKTAFTIRYGTYEYLVVPFGLYNVLSTF